MRKTIFVIAIIVIAVLGGYLVFDGMRQPVSSVSPVSSSQATPQSTVPDLAVQESESTMPPAVGPGMAGVEKKTTTVTYTNDGFSPATLTIKKGEMVIFKNNSAQSMWPASAKHPTHAVYPTTGGCIGSTFDACKGIQPGESWSFQFDIAGSWKYHNHLNPSDFGAVMVD